VPHILTSEELAFSKLFEADKAGDPDAGYALGMGLYQANTIPANEGALRHFLAVQDRNLNARFMVGKMMVEGAGAPADPDSGLSFLRSASAAGKEPATNYLKTVPRRSGNVGEFSSMLTRVDDAFYSQSLMQMGDFAPSKKVTKWEKELIKMMDEHSNEGKQYGL
jgi:TPR repeat protein